MIDQIGGMILAMGCLGAAIWAAERGLCGRSDMIWIMVFCLLAMTVTFGVIAVTHGQYH